MFGRLVACVALLAASLGTAMAEQRIALIIGNGAYQDNPALLNPPADARVIARTLTGVGFRVTTLIDADQAAMKAAIAEFGRALRSAGPDTVGLFYYAGHGVQASGSNYLIPVRGTIRDEADLDLVGVEARWVVRQMESARNVTNIVILDACRDNPFATATAGAPSRGLARMDAPTGTFIAYATAPGDVALDGSGANSPFTAALAQAMAQPGIAIEQMFKQVRVQVLRETAGRQTPWDSSSLVRDFSFTPLAAAATRDTAEQQVWDSVRGSADPVQLVLFLRSYPQSQFAAEARRLLQSALAAPAPIAAVPAPVVPPSVAQPSAAAAGGIRFSSPIPGAQPPIAGRSIEQLAQGVPSFAPIEGLPAEAWQNKPCSTCHAWTRAALCEQGQFYFKAEGTRAISKPHPYGAAFKIALRNWAGQGCKE